MVKLNNYKTLIFLNALKSIYCLEQKIIAMHHGVNIIKKIKYDNNSTEDRSNINGINLI